MLTPRQLDLFHLDEDRPGFEDLGKMNGGKFWYARDFMRMLGYESFEAFRKPINKAIATCTALEIQVVENFKQVQRQLDGEIVQDFKLTRFACYLVAINGDVRKPDVAAAQAYFVTMAEAFRNYIQGSDNVERVQIRDEVSERERSWSSTAHHAGVQNFAFFQAAGYRGMYNMSMPELRSIKGVPGGRSLMDFMGRQELAANLFRITQTEAKINNEEIRGQRSLENAAMHVGKTVRNTMIKISGQPPESLTSVEDIIVVKRKLKRARTEFGRMDKPSIKQSLLPGSSNPSTQL